MQAIKAREGKNWEQRKIRERLERNDESSLASPGGVSPVRQGSKGLSPNKSKNKLTFIVSKTMNESSLDALESKSSASRIFRQRTNSFSSANHSNHN